MRTLEINRRKSRPIKSINKYVCDYCVQKIKLKDFQIKIMNTVFEDEIYSYAGKMEKY